MNAEVPTRVKSARIKAGYSRRPDLAAQITLPRFGKEVLGQVERGERPLHEHEAAELGRILGVEPEYFYGGEPAGELQEVLWKLDLIIDHLGISAAQDFSAAIEGGAASGSSSGSDRGQRSERARDMAGRQHSRSA